MKKVHCLSSLALFKEDLEIYSVLSHFLLFVAKSLSFLLSFTSSLLSFVC